MARKLPRLIASAALSTCLAGAASAGCPITGEEMDMMTAGGEARCFAATPTASISPGGGGGSSSSSSSSSSSAIAPAGGAATPSGFSMVIGSGFGGAISAAPLMGIGRIGAPFLHDTAVNPGSVNTGGVATAQFIAGGLQGELSFASTSAPPAVPTASPAYLEVHLSTPFSAINPSTGGGVAPDNLEAVIEFLTQL